MKTNQQIAIEVLMGKWGNGSERIRRLLAAGYDSTSIQSIVDALVLDGAFPEEKAFEITGTETLEIEIDVTKYNSIAVTFVKES